MKWNEFGVEVTVEVDEARGAWDWCVAAWRLYCSGVAVSVALMVTVGTDADFVRPVFEASAFIGVVCIAVGLLLKWGVLQLARKRG